MVPFVFGGHDWQLLPGSAVFWPSRRALIVADLHFEKASWFARTGQYLPPFEACEQSLYVGRVIRSTLCDPIPVNPHQEIMREFKLAADSQLEAFISDSREEVQRLMQAA
jgi:hypothetical protein